MADKLKEYRLKRDFRKTLEPAGAMAVRWSLVRMRGEGGRRRTSGKHWLLTKRTDSTPPALNPHDVSVLSGRTMEEIARQAGQQPAPFKPGRLEGARRKPMPARIEPQLATLADNAPTGEDWLHEIKLDGYRIMARLDKGEVILATRNGKDWSPNGEQRDTGLGELTRDELYERARELEIPGRSNMSKQQLVKALSDPPGDDT